VGCPLPAPSVRNLSAGLKLSPTLLTSGPFAPYPGYMAEKAFLLSRTDDFADLSQWIVTDSGGNVNLVGGVVYENGNNVNNANGISLAGGVPRAEGYQEFQLQPLTAVPYDIYSFASTQALQSWGLGAMCHHVNVNKFAFAGIEGRYPDCSSCLPTFGNWYTIRSYVLKGPDGHWNRSRITIQGNPEWPNETQVLEGSAMYEGDIWSSATLYPQFHRYLNDGAHLSMMRLWRWCTGYSAAGEVDERIYDAGAGGIFINFDLSNLIEGGPLLGGAIPSTNLLYAYSFDDGVAAYSAWKTLAQLNGLGKIMGRHRYARIKTQVNGSASTQVYNVGLNAASVIDFIVVPAAVPSWNVPEVSGIH